MTQSTSDEDAAKAALLSAAAKVIEARSALAKAQATYGVAVGEVPAKSETEDHWSNYAEYNKTLRAWFVSFGIGAPALFLVNPGLLESLKGSSAGSCIVVLFLVGCGSQIFVALLNKIISWHLYCGEREPGFKGKWRYRLSDILNTFLIDAMADVVSFVCFAVAVVQLFQMSLSELPSLQSPSMPR